MISGVVWADTNRDQTHQAGEVSRAGVTVQLVTSPDGAVVATTTTAANGTYSFAGVADGDYRVVVTAPGAFVFPAAASGDNDFARQGVPTPGQPERGQSAQFTIAGDTQVTGLDAGMQPIADLVVARLPVADGCEGFAVTGTPPFDASEGPGQDTGPGNCVVRVGDTVSQNYSVSLTGLPTGASVPNVVAEFTISSPDGATLELVGPGADGLPSGCLAAAQGANPPSSRTINPDGSITVLCNLGTMSSNVAALQLAYRFAGNTPIPSHASIEMHAFAAGGEAGTSNTVEGPTVEVTGTGQWDLEKVLYPGAANVARGPDYTVRTIDGAEVDGYLMRYLFNITDLTDGAGGSDLVWPATFTDQMPEFPNARIVECRPTNLGDNPAIRSPWTLTCPLDEVQGADGWDLSIRPNSGDGSDTGVGHMVMTVFIPMADMNRAIDPTWQVGDPTPTGSFDFDNRAQDTDHWAINGGALNFGDGHEPGWDGTGNNLATLQGNAAPPQWDLQKNFRGGPAFSTETIDGVPVDGYFVEYDFRVLDLAGPDNIGPWLDRPITFNDRLVSHPGAILLHCRDLQPDPNVAATCETGVQPADGWEFSVTPNQRGFNNRRLDFIARIFIPMDEMPSDPCVTNVTIDLRNEAVDSEHWTVAGQPNNGTGFEPGWDGTTATGNNLDVRSVRPAASQCGTLLGDKRYIRVETGGVHQPDPNSSVPSFAGSLLDSRVNLVASSNRVSVTDMRLCDVFDVSTMQIRTDRDPWIVVNSGDVNPADYVIEYAIGPNEVDTQAGPFDPTANLFPIDSSSLAEAAADCRTHAGPWSTDPEADFGADWRDRVNMVRVRPIDPTLTEVGPFNVELKTPLRVRGVYNGGPNDGELIPHRIRLANAGGWPAGSTGDGWNSVVRERRFEGPQLLVDKNVSPTQYLPGAQVVWDLNVTADRTQAGMTMFNLQVVDTIPENLHFDLACTQALLPAGVTVSYNSTTRQATFSAGDIEIVSTGTSQVIFHPTAAGARHLRICTTVDTLAQPGSTHINTVQARADNSVDAPTATATIQVVGAGQMGISKRVDKQFVASGDQYTWSLDWGNTSTVIAFQPPDVIDVLPWNGDGADDALSGRDQFASDYEGLAQLVGPLAAPTYIVGGTGVGSNVPGTWYYATADPSTIDHDPRVAANADPAAAGGLWLTAAEIGAGAGFGAVTAVRFVSDEFLPVQSRVRALIPAVSTSDALDNVYVNRAMIFSATFADQALLSNEPFVLMPGFTLGDLIWRDDDEDGVFDVGEVGIPGVQVEILDGNGAVVGTATTDANGRWLVSALPEGTYTVRVPASEFVDGGPLAAYKVLTAGSSASETENEGVGNNNTATPDPAATGLVSTPVTLTYTRAANGDIIGANGPVGDNVAGLGDPIIPDDFTNFTVDLAFAPRPGISLVKIGDRTTAEQAEDIVNYEFLVTNTGNTRLDDITVTDTFTAPAGPELIITCPVTTLAPGESVTCTGSPYRVTQADVDHGRIDNTAVARGTSPVNETVETPPVHWEVIIPPAPAITLVKTGDRETADVVGDMVNYEYLVTNTGNVTLTDVNVTDVFTPPAGPPVTVTCPETTLAPGESTTCTGTPYTVTQADVDRGRIDNTATAHGTPPTGPQVDSPEDEWEVVLPQTPAITLVKTGDRETADVVGDIVNYTYLVTNTGNVTLTDVNVPDVFTPPAGPPVTVVCPTTTLAPGEATTCIGSPYTVTQADVDNGRIDNVATARGTTRTGSPVESSPDDWEVIIEPVPGMTLVKEADSTQPRRVGEVINYTMVVTNTGNVTLHDIVVTDVFTPPAGPELTITCPQTVLVSGEAMICTSSPYTVTQADVDNGEVVNTAQVVGITPGGERVSPPKVTVEVPTIASPAPLPVTGSNIWRLAAIGGLLILLGLVMIMVARRVRRGAAA